MRHAIEAAISHYHQFVAGGGYLGMYFMGILYLLVSKKKTENKRMFCGYTVFFAFLYLFPVTAYIIMNYCIGELVYWRMMWLLPVWTVIAYVLTEWQGKIESTVSRRIFAGAAMLILICGGSAVYNRQNFQKAENAYKIPDEVIEVCDTITADAQKEEEDHIKAAVSNELNIFIRQYSGEIAMPYGRNAMKGQKLGKRDAYIYQSITTSVYDWKKFASVLKKEKCNYFVCSVTVPDRIQIENYGFEQIAQLENYTIYRCKEEL